MTYQEVGRPNSSGIYMIGSGPSIRWKGDPDDSRRLDELMKRASRLQQLVLRKTYAEDGITPAEHAEAMCLAANGLEAEPIAACGYDCDEPSIGDTGICREHLLQFFGA